MVAGIKVRRKGFSPFYAEIAPAFGKAPLMRFPCLAMIGSSDASNTVLLAGAQSPP